MYGRSVSIYAMRILYFNTIFFIFFLISAFAKPSFSSSIDLNDEILVCLKNGDVKGLVRYFNSSINLSLNREEGYYSKFQSELILNEFFRSNKPRELKQIQKISNNSNNLYMIYQMKTDSKNYRIFLRMIKVEGEMKITEIRIE